MNITLSHLDLPITLIPDVPLNDEALLRFCADNDLLRVERTRQGELRLMSPSGGETSAWNAEIIYQLTAWARRVGGGVAFESNAGFTLADGSMMSPDAAWISVNRWKSLTQVERKRFAPICPEFVIELRSPSDRLPDLEAKMQLWLENGAILAWLIDPQSRSVTVYSTGLPPQLLASPVYVQGREPVGSFVLDLTFIWDQS